MTLAELVEAEGPGNRFPPRCRVAMVRAALNARDQEILDRLVAELLDTTVEDVVRAGLTAVVREHRAELDARARELTERFGLVAVIP